MFALAQQPFQAELWRKLREAKDKWASQAGDDEKSKKNSKVAFWKLDLTAPIVSKQLHTRDALLANVQQHGTAAMQVVVHKNQRIRRGHRGGVGVVFCPRARSFGKDGGPRDLRYKTF